jgi:trimethylamine--corrinoid protein Co-methyltransferase
VTVDCEGALKLLSNAGAVVDLRRKLVKIPSSLLEEMVKKGLSGCETLHARDSKHDVTFGDGKIHVMTDGTGIKTLDIDTGQIRNSTKQDVADSARLADALGNVHVYFTMVDALDVPEEAMRLEEFEAMLCNTGKNLCHSAKGKTEAKRVIRMASAVAGGFDELRKRPMFFMMQTPVSPLVHNRENTESILEAAKYGVPMTILNMPQAGMTSPITIAGTLALSNAEILSGMLIAKLANPDAPLVYGSCAIVSDVRMGDYPFMCGVAESGLISAANVQLAHSYDCPCIVGIEYGSVLEDASSAYKVLTAMLVANAKADVLFGTGLIGKSTVLSLEEMVIDNDVAGMVLRAAKGIEVNDETLSLDVTSAVGPGGHFMSQRHTINHVAKELFIPEIFDKVDPKDLPNLAKQKAKQILATHQPAPLDEEIKRQLRSIIKEARKQTAEA